MKWYYIAAVIVLLCILSSGTPAKTTAPRIKKETCIDANVFSPDWGKVVACDGDDDVPSSTMDDEEGLTAGGETSEAGAAFNPTGFGATFITYDKS